MKLVSHFNLQFINLRYKNYLEPYRLSVSDTIIFTLLRNNIKPCKYCSKSGPGSSVGIATDYGLDGPGSNPGGDEIFCPSRLALEPTQPPAKWVPGLSRG